MAEYIAARLGDGDFKLLLALKDELGMSSTSDVIRWSLLAFRADKRLREKTRELMEEMMQLKEMDARREISRKKLRGLTLLHNQVKLINRLRKDGLPRTELSMAVATLEDEGRSYGLKEGYLKRVFRHGGVKVVRQD